MGNMIVALQPASAPDAAGGRKGAAIGVRDRGRGAMMGNAGIISRI